MKWSVVRGDDVIHIVRSKNQDSGNDRQAQAWTSLWRI
ncbi:hypothetical protein RISK_000546 [Rhodopirellula islandica]|uniref:Uncharacterized protein n=1 Tax=Rhodopirellula islandica TaxID=595434 RepID=A0A0J1BLY0_RHOIS|nr:hypothetical protein RISK_000546 [Rhodopirellula islandica]